MSRPYEHDVDCAVVIIGAGFGGIAAAVALRQAGIEDFVIFEKSPHPGGTWWENRYPGAEVDTPSFIYSYSFMKHVWSRTHARQSEIFEYLQGVISEFDLAPHFRFNTAVVSATWSDDSQRYQVRLDDESDLACESVISCVGFLNTPNLPAWVDDSEFMGRIFHTSRWPEALDLAGKRVAIVGTGSTAVQIVGEIASEVDHLFVFQRQPNWIVPKRDRDLTAMERKRLEARPRYKWARLTHYIESERGRFGGKEARIGTRANSRRHRLAIEHLQTTMASRPDLRAVLTPDYPFYGKRPIVNNTFYPALLRDNVTLIPRSTAGLTMDSIVDENGDHHQVDVVIVSTGFQATNYLSNLRVHGRSGVELHDAWADDPEGFLGIMVPEFPNFYMLYGPNTNAGPVVFFLEVQAAFAAASIRRMRTHCAATIEVRRSYSGAFNVWIQRRLAKTVWGSTDNYFKSSTGKVVTQWPSGATLYWAMAKLLRIPSTQLRGRSVPGHSRISEEPR